MKLTTKMRYGTRAMLDLALHTQSGTVSLKEMAGRQQLSAKYMEHLLAALQNGGLVRAERGARGGYQLARPAEAITLRQVYEILEGSEGFVECVGEPAVCSRADECVTREVWAQMQAACMGVLEALTVAELAERARQRQGDALMYHI
jgi:Rrf2 family protein